MIPIPQILASVMFLLTLAHGNVATYRAGVFRQVANNRGMVMLPWVDGYASTKKCSRVDTKADPTLKTRPYLALASINGGHVEVYQVVDCSDPRDLAQQARHGLVFEIDHWSGIRNGVTVLDRDARIFSIYRLNP